MAQSGEPNPSFQAIIAYLSELTTPVQSHSFSATQRDRATTNHFTQAAMHVHRMAMATGQPWAPTYASMIFFLAVEEPHASATMLTNFEAVMHPDLIAHGLESPFCDADSLEFSNARLRTITRPLQNQFMVRVAKMPSASVPQHAPSVAAAAANTTNARTRPDNTTELCDKFNIGNCSKPFCKYRHKCAGCGSHHPVKDCKAGGAAKALVACKSAMSARELSKHKPRP
jgi:hypothetical protein